MAQIGGEVQRGVDLAIDARQIELDVVIVHVVFTRVLGYSGMLLELRRHLKRYYALYILTGYEHFIVEQVFL